MTRTRTSSDIIKLLEICRNIEMTAAKLYHFYAELFKDDPEHARLWSKTAMEEEEHTRHFDMAINLRNQWEIETVSVDIEKAESMFQLIKVIYDAVLTTRPTLIDALGSAIDLEAAFAEFHMSSVANFKEDSHKKFFNSLMQSDRRHLLDLEEAHRKLLQQ